MSIPAEQLQPPRLPTEDELPCDDGVPMETPRHRLQMEVLIRSLDPWAAARGDVFVSGNQFIYFSATQLRGRDFRGPDVFVVVDVERRERKSWVVWEEDKGPEVVIELLSDSTIETDKTQKKRIYQDQMRVPEYFWFDPFNVEDRAGFILQGGHYQPIPPDADGRLPVPSLGLLLVLWDGEYMGLETQWLRWADPDGGLLLLPEETEKLRADEERQRADAAEAELARLRAGMTAR
jgi:Uma2 family endonuclease